ncbi:MAG: FtsX-like permease family protein [Bacteroidales bacterium]|nr:FtsX-like permease family protein [Bacteroidales bacterium]
MRLPLFIANRYLLAKKSHNLINIITWISIIGISVASFALIVVLSAFNGLEEVISSLNNRLTPDLQITSAKGKTVDLATLPMDQLKGIQGVDFVVPTIEEDALFRANDKQHIGQVKGVGPEYEQIERFGEAMFNHQKMVFSEGDTRFAIPGTGVAWYLGVSPYDPYSMIRIYVPKRGNASMMSLESGFNTGVLSARSVFATEQEQDEKMVLVPFDWLSELLEYDNKANAVELFLGPRADVGKVQKSVKSLLGEGFVVKNQKEQLETLYKVMRSEKWAVYVILTFILILATFNVVGSLSMLMIDKRKDTQILKSMGADNALIQRIFMNEGLLIAVAGGIIGLLLGILLVFLQQQFGFVKFGTGGSYVVDTYPVHLKGKDVLLIFGTILVVGCTSAFLTVRHALRKGAFQSGSSAQ